uniref:acylphosphatase n=1 Tax=Candidatus Kentrum sp. LPFa TaxID=2126335 RepID=A0A450VQZ3_9GAMM|nr:MAG: acylphosphatase [Candidatus Kentron sp. LPFa]
MKISRRCLVSSRVQEVFFRASTHEKAAKRGVSAQAVNLADGRVRIAIQGRLRKVAGPGDVVVAGTASRLGDDVQRAGVTEGSSG